MSNFSVQIGQMTNQSERMHSRPRPFCAVLRLCRYLSRKFRKSKSLWNEHSNCARRAGAEQQQQRQMEEEDQQPEAVLRSSRAHALVSAHFSLIREEERCAS